jgi:hypothetical protein
MVKSKGNIFFRKYSVLGTTALLVFLAWYLSFLYFRARNAERVKPTGSKELRKFYIYPWSEDIVNLWPDKYTHHRLSTKSVFKENFGAGPLVDRDRGFYHTHQYSLFTLIYQRLLRSKYRALNPSEASVFFIPYDLGMDGSTRKTDGALAQTNCPKVAEVIGLLNNSPYFKKNGGSDHFLLHSINQMMLYYANEPCTNLYKLCYNCTKLSIDAYDANVYDYLNTHQYMSHNWVSIPFPSNYHYSFAGTTTRPPWLDVLRSPQYMREEYQLQRPYALSFVGTTLVTAKQQQKLRKKIIEVCASMPQACLSVQLASHQSHESIVVTEEGPKGQSYTQQNSSTISNIKSDSESNPYLKSRLCLMPGKSLYFELNLSFVHVSFFLSFFFFIF